MSFDGSGTFTPAASPNFPAVGGQVINASYYNAVINDIAAGLTNTLTRDGQGKPTTNIDWNAKNLTNVATFGAVTGNFSGTVTAVAFVGPLTGNASTATTAATATNSLSLGGTLAANFLQTANLLTAILAVDGAGSGIDADLLDGQQGAAYALLNSSPIFTGTLTAGSGVGTGAATVEVGGGRSGSGTANVDFHAVTGADFTARIIRAGGANGNFDIVNTGIAAIRLQNPSGDTIFDNAAESVRITNAGNVGIGIATPQGKLQVKDGTDENFLVRGNLNLADGVTLYSVNDANSATRSMEFAASVYYFAGGNVGIGLTNPTSLLHVNGVIQDDKGNVRRLIKSGETSGTLTSASANEIVRATGGVTLNGSVFTDNDSVVILNKSGGAITITVGGGLTLTSTTGATGNRTLASNGMATVWFNTASDAHISGSGLT